MFLSCQAGLVAGAKYHKKVNGKTFSYVGKEDYGSFIEEYAFLVISKFSAALKDKRIEAVVITEASVFLVFLNDQSSSSDGSSSMEYSRKDFNDEDIMGFLNDHIDDISDLLFIDMDTDKEKELVSMKREKDNISFEVNFNDIKPEIMISGFKKITKLVKTYYVYVLIVTVIVITPLIGIKIVQKMNENGDIEIRGLELQINKGNILKNKLQSENQNQRGERMDVIGMKDIFHDTSLMTQLLRLSDFDINQAPQMPQMPGVSNVPGQMPQMSNVPGQMPQMPGVPQFTQKTGDTAKMNNVDIPNTSGQLNQMQQIK